MTSLESKAMELERSSIKESKGTILIQDGCPVVECNFCRKFKDKGTQEWYNPSIEKRVEYNQMYDIPFEICPSCMGFEDDY